MSSDIVNWLTGGTAFFQAQAEVLREPGRPASEISAPSLLPGWTRAHVVTHVARSADALGNLLTWARTGVETPMYGDLAQRSADIESGAARTSPEILADLAASTDRFDAQLASMPPHAWTATVTTAHGRVVPASTIPWLRVREVWVHAVDLDTGATFSDLPHDLALRLLADVTDSFRNRSCPAVTMRPTDADTVFTTQPNPSSTAPFVARSTAELLQWATGRGGPDLPSLPPWL